MGQKKQKKKTQALAQKFDHVPDMDLQNEFLRINLSNQKNSVNITDLKDDFNKRLTNRLMMNIMSTQDNVHDMWQAAKTPKNLCQLFSKISDHVRAKNVSNRPSINIDTLNLDYNCEDNPLPNDVA